MNGPHPTHKLRFSWDASTWDYICEQCGYTDEVPGGWRELVNPCRGKQNVEDITKCITIEQKTVEGG